MTQDRVTGTRDHGSGISGYQGTVNAVVARFRQQEVFFKIICKKTGVFYVLVYRGNRNDQASGTWQQ